MSRVQLAKIPALTFYKNEWTEGRRTSPIPQLTCVGKPCSLFTPDVVRCESLGGSGTEIDWKCTADLPDSLRLGRVEVGCEGWSKAGDPYVLKGSCALEYRLVQVPGTLRNSNSDNFSQKSDTMSAAFMIFWLVVVGVILYALYASCMDTDTNRHRAPSPPRTRPDTGGFFPGGFNNPHDDSAAPPPPYSKTQPTNAANAANAGWVPGFWTGAALGGLGAHWYNSRQNNRDRAYDWERDRAYSRQQPPTPLFQRRSAPRYSSDDRGEGTSNLGTMRQSTGFGGSNVR